MLLLCNIDVHNHTVNINFCKQYFENKCVEFSITEGLYSTYIEWTRTLNLPFRYSDFYNINNQKYISNKWLNLPLVLAKHIIKGLINIYVSRPR